MKFCPSCGKSIKKGTFCKECEPLPEIKVKEIKLRLCSGCSRYFHKNKWNRFNKIEHVIEKVAREQLIKQLEEFQVKVKLPKYTNNAGVNVKFEIEIIKGNNCFVLPGSLDITYCSICSKKDTEYFEGNLQLRNPTQYILDFIDNYFTNQNKRVLITKKIKQKNGIDIKITSKKHLQDLGNKLQDNFGGTLKISPHLQTFDHQTSKHVYRLNVYFKALDFNVNDVIKSDNKLIKISKLGKIVYGKDIKNNKSVSIDLKNKEYTVLEKHITSVSKIHPYTEILHPKTYQSVRIENKKKVQIGERVKVVIDGGESYIV
ncbi:hypothetical protein JXB41_04250 [Candidatus Woesearchaeota archaeon]|nr:hypothetical protein [Candidatus Woesearchaeota archaeon]